MFIKQILRPGSCWQFPPGHQVWGSPQWLTGQKVVKGRGAGADWALTGWNCKGFWEWRWHQKVRREKAFRYMGQWWVWQTYAHTQNCREHMGTGPGAGAHAGDSTYGRWMLGNGQCETSSGYRGRRRVTHAAVHMGRWGLWVLSKEAKEWQGGLPTLKYVSGGLGGSDGYSSASLGRNPGCENSLEASRLGKQGRLCLLWGQILGLQCPKERRERKEEEKGGRREGGGESRGGQRNGQTGQGEGDFDFTSKHQDSRGETDVRQVWGGGYRTGKQAHSTFLTRWRGPQRLAEVGPKGTESLLVCKGLESELQGRGALEPWPLHAF